MNANLLTCRFNLNLVIFLLGLLVRINAIDEISTNQLDEADQDVSQIETTPALEIERRQNPDIVISSLEDGLLTESKSTSDRHHYEQQAEQTPSDKQQQPSTPAPSAQQQQQPQSASPQAAPATEGPSASSSKPESRNYEEAAQDPVILDHRPSGPSEQVSHTDLSNQHLQSQTTQPPQHPSSGGATSGQHGYASSPNQNQAQAQTQNQQGSQMGASSWYPAQPPQQQQTPSPVYAQPGVQQGGQPILASNGYGSQASASNQVISVQHPTSINSIINDHQSQQQVQQPSVQIGLATTNQPAQSIQNQMLPMNGQPSMMLMNPNPIIGGRRISISGWLKGISSMLANIFNRREHGGLLAGQTSNQYGTWVQYGPTGPHWLTQAQTAIQQQQFQQQQQQFNNNPQMLSSASTNRFANYVQSPQPNTIPPSQQPQAAIISMQPSGSMAASQPMQTAYQQAVDLQPSGSSLSYVAVQPPSLQHQSVQMGQTSANNQMPGQSGAGSVLMSARQQPMIVADQQARQTGAQQINSGPPSTNPSAGSTSQQVPWSTGSASTATNLPQATQSRFGRSPLSSNVSQNLPLAHYSRYGGVAD